MLSVSQKKNEAVKSVLDKDYVRYIIDGLRERSISAECIDKVKTIASANNPRRL